jgi:malic enzyme
VLRITDRMFLAAARSRAQQATPPDPAQGSPYPPLAGLREVSAHVAVAVVLVAFDLGHAGLEAPADLLAHARSRTYDPQYPVYA